MWRIKSKICSQKILYFGVDGVSTFQRTKIEIIKQININYAPISFGVHCMVHKCKLTFKTLYCLEIMSSIEDLLYTCHIYFVNNLNKHFRLIKFIDMIETNGLKMFKNVKTQLIFLLELQGKICYNINHYSSICASMAQTTMQLRYIVVNQKPFISFIDLYVCFFKVP